MRMYCIRFRTHTQVTRWQRGTKTTAEGSRRTETNAEGSRRMETTTGSKGAGERHDDNREPEIDTRFVDLDNKRSRGGGAIGTLKKRRRRREMEAEAEAEARGAGVEREGRRETTGEGRQGREAGGERAAFWDGGNREGGRETRGRKKGAGRRRRKMEAGGGRAADDG
ncbi:hypothetical protein ACLOJK_033898 [Asimina triloba]